MTSFSLRFVAAILLFTVSSSLVSAHTATDLEAIRQAIDDRGAAWTAGPGLMWNLTKDEARLRRGDSLETAAQPPRGSRIAGVGRDGAHGELLHQRIVLSS